MSRYICRCRTCPRCEWTGEDPRDWRHPEDGLADCPRCNNEWWVSCGWRMDGRCPKDRAEEAAWRAYDDRVAQGLES